MDLESCLYNDDKNNYHDDWTVESLVVGGIEYVPPPQTLSSNLITIGSYAWDTRLADFINSLNIPNFYSVYPSEADLIAVDAIDYPGLEDPRPMNAIRLVIETGVEFTLITFATSGFWQRLTNNNSEIGGDGVNWIVDADDNFYLFHKILCENL